MTCSVISVKRVRPLLGTFVEITLQGRAEERFLQRCITRGFSAVEQVDRLMSVHRADSDISKLNRSTAGHWIRLDPLTLKVLSEAMALYRATDGLFDIRSHTNGPPLTSPLPQGERNKSINSSPLGGEGRVRGGPPLEVNGTRVRKTGPWVFDLGGIAKGFAVDQAVKCIQRLTSKLPLSGIVNAGGDLRMWGNSSMSLAVRIDGSNRSWIKSVNASALAMATSAVRRTRASRTTAASYRYFRSGRTLRRLDTATVVAESCLWADALTKVVLLGNKQNAARCLSFYGAQAVIHDGAGRTREVIA